jgi:glycerol-3-phosphate acyltransferase PlsX
MKIAVDAMGGDHAPQMIVKGAVEAAGEQGISVILVGDQKLVEAELAHYCTDGLPIEIKHASEVVQMDEHPANSIRRKPDSSIVVAADLVNSGEAQAMISAGNTGAAMAVATLKFGRIKGIGRPAIGSLLPTLNGAAVILDAGANVDCSVENLLQFAVMGSEYAEKVLKLANPRVGLLSIGEEPSKGNELTKAANAALSRMELNFIGNVEGKDIFHGAADVVVCDGFDGNIVLKVAEGIAEFMLSSLKEEISRSSLLCKLGVLLLQPALRRSKAKLDYAEYGGAPLLGVNGVCIISHGRSDARAIRNAIRAAATAVENDIVNCISASVRQKELVSS